MHILSLNVKLFARGLEMVRNVRLAEHFCSVLCQVQIHEYSAMLKS